MFHRNRRRLTYLINIIRVEMQFYEISVQTGVGELLPEIAAFMREFQSNLGLRMFFCAANRISNKRSLKLIRTVFFDRRALRDSTADEHRVQTGTNDSDLPILRADCVPIRTTVRTRNQQITSNFADCRSDCLTLFLGLSKIER